MPAMKHSIWPTFTKATSARFRAIALICGIFLAAFSATIVFRLAIALALLADGYAK